MKIQTLTLFVLFSLFKNATAQTTIEQINYKLYYGNNYEYVDVDGDQINDIGFYRGGYPIDSDIMGVFALSDSIEISDATILNNNFVWSPLFFDSLKWVAEKSISSLSPFAGNWFGYPGPMNNINYISYYKKYSSTDSLFGYFKFMCSEGPYEYGYDDTLFVFNHVQANNHNDELIAGEHCDFNFVKENDYGCYNGCIGAIDTEIHGGIAPFNFTWSNGETTQNIDSLCTGIYNLTVTDANGCVWQDTIFIDSTDLTTEILLFGSLNGSCTIDAHVQVTGQDPFTYSWTNGSASFNSYNLCDGWHYVTVTDSVGCSVTDSVEITASNLFSATISEPIVISGLPCGTPECNGTTTIDIANGIPPYILTVSNGFVDTTYDNTILDSLCVGDYSYTVEDSTGQIITNYFEVQQHTGIYYWYFEYSPPTCLTCNDGWLEYSATGGTGPYLYYFHSDPWNYDLQVNNGYYDNLGYGNFMLCVEDGSGCEYCEHFSFDTLICDLYATINPISPSCYGDSDGSVIYDIYYGQGPVAISTTQGSINLIGCSTFSINGLSEGNIDLTITDGNGCVYTENNIYVPNPDSIEVIVENIVPASCGSCNDGMFDISGIGGTPPYTYSIDGGVNFQMNNSFSGLYPGNYTICVQDSLNCSNCAVFNLDTCTVSSNVIIDSLVCPENCDASAVINVFQGELPYSIIYNQGTLLTNSDSSFVLNNLCLDSLQIQIIADDGCTLNAEYMIINPDSLNFNYSQLNIASCTTCNDGSAQLTIIGGSAPYVVDWSAFSSSETGAQADSLVGGSGLVCVTDANGCQFCDSVTVDFVDDSGIDDGVFDFSISPNPTHGQALIHSSAFLDHLEIVDLRGRIISTININGNAYELDVTSLPSGLYLIKVYASGSMVKKKLIVH